MAESDTQAAIEIRNVVKEYAGAGDAPPKLALKGLSFDVPEGGIFGLLGPNGAGKSTLINIMAGLVSKTSGTIRIWGHDIDRDHRNAKLNIGIVPQEIVFDPFFTPFEVLENQGGMYGVAKALRRSDKLLEAVHLADKRDAYSRSLSGGMKRRLLIAKALVHAPPILVLDEPTAGVDVELRRQLWELVSQLNAEGVTVVLTTHYLEEAEVLCSRIAMMKGGEIVALDSTANLLNRLPSKNLRLKLGAATLPASLVGRLRTQDSDFYTLALDDVGQIEQVLAELRTAGIAIEDMQLLEADLEDVFIDLVGRK